MKKIATTICLLGCLFVNTVASASMILEYDGGVHNYTGNVYSLSVNGKTLSDLPLEPIIFNDRALVPVREIFEELGADVDYNTEDKSITVSYEKKIVELQIGSSSAKVDGKKQEIPDGVAPKLIAKWGESAKTMVPVRFISENIGLDVEFDSEKGHIDVSDLKPRPSSNPTKEPEDTGEVKINKVSSVYENDIVEVTVSANGVIEKISKPSLTAAGVLFVDAYGVKYLIDNRTEIEQGPVAAVRVGLHDDCTRIAIDTEGVEKYSVSLSADKKEIIFRISDDENADIEPDETPAPSAKPTTSPSVKPSASPSSKPTANPTTSPSPSQTPKPIKYDSKKIVVIDAGHGGSDPGTQGNLMNEEELEAYEKAVASTELILATMAPGTGKKYYEKDIALSVAKKVKQNLEANDIEVIMTREKDTYPELDERPELANEEGAVIFVSIHLNSTVSPVTAAKGIEVFYSEQNNDDDISLTSKQLANLLLDKTIDSTDAFSRGVKTGNLLVNRKCMMPSALIEIGFMNNPIELANMITESYQDKLAAGISQGILAAWKKVELPKLSDKVPSITNKTK